MLRAFLALILTFGLVGAAMAQQTGQAGTPSVSGANQALEDIMARQNGTWRRPDLPMTGAPPEIAPIGTGGFGNQGASSDSELWRLLKQGAPTTSAVGNGGGNGSVIQVLGENWRLFRNDYLLKYTPWMLAVSFGMIVLIYLVLGQIKIEGGRTGRMIQRFSMSYRVAHWFLAGTFFVMAVSGVLVMLGRSLLVPWIGKSANAVITNAALQSHNFVGPVFILALLIVTFRFLKGNFFQWVDFKWLLKGGGLIGGHASSHRYNFGEKAWYWMVVLIGLIMSATGLLLEFPWFTDVLVWHQVSSIVHAIGAIGLICVAMGHAYIGSIGMEGSLDSMVRGEVDENWAREHHDLWYAEVTGTPPSGDDKKAKS